MFCFSLRWHVVQEWNDFIDQTVIMEGVSPPSYSPWMRDFMSCTKLGKVIRPGSRNNLKKCCTFLPRKFLSNPPPPFLSVFSGYILLRCDLIHSIFYQWICSLFIIVLFVSITTITYVFSLSLFNSKAILSVVWKVCVSLCVCLFAVWAWECACKRACVDSEIKKNQFHVFPCCFQLNKNTF